MGRDLENTVRGTKASSTAAPHVALGPLNATPKVGASHVLHSSCSASCAGLTSLVAGHALGVACDAGADGAGTAATRPLTVSKGRTPMGSLWRFLSDAAQRLWGERDLPADKACEQGVGGLPETDAGHQRISTSSLGSATATDTSGLSQEEHRERRGDAVKDSWEANNQWKVLGTTDGWEEICWKGSGAAEETSVKGPCDRCDSWTPRRCHHEFADQGPGFGKWDARAPAGSLDELERYLNAIVEDEVELQSVGNRSAPAGCFTSRRSDVDVGCGAPEGVFGAPEDELSDGDDFFFTREYKTVLDLLEMAGELRRQEVVYRITCEKKEMLRLRNDVRARKLEFELLKTGMYMVTPRVKHLRQRWGSKQRIKFRERLARMKQSEEDDLWNSIPLLEC